MERKNKFSKLMDKDINEVIRGYKILGSANAVSQKLNIDIRTILKYLRNKGIYKEYCKRRFFTEKDKKNIIKMYSQQNKTPSEIAKLFDVEFKTILRLLRQERVKIRSSSEIRILRNNYQCNLKDKTYEEYYGKQRAKKIRKKVSENHRDYQSDKTKKIISKLSKEKWENPEYREKTIKAQLKGLLKRPTSFEQKICDLCLKYHLPFIYSGDGKLLVGYKNPDFKHKYLPILIEVYNDYHHPKDYEEKRGNHFKKYGHKTIFINQQEIMDKNWENICLNKINNFLK